MPRARHGIIASSPLPSRLLAWYHGTVPLDEMRVLWEEPKTPSTGQGKRNDTKRPINPGR